MAVEIVKTQSAARYARDNSVVREIEVTYYVGEKDGPFTMRFPEGTSGYDMRQAIERHEREIAALRGR